MMRSSRTSSAGICACVLLSIGAARAQHVSPHILVGVPVTTTFTDVYRAARIGGEQFLAGKSQYLIGGGVQIPLRTSLHLDLSVLYGRVSYESSENGRTTGIPVTIVSATSAAYDRWQFPTLIAYGRRDGIRPFAGTGISFSVLSRLRGWTAGTTTSPLEGTTSFTRTPVDDAQRLAFGWVSGAGITIPAGIVKVQPQLRYTLWILSNTSGPQYGSNQLDVMLAIRF